MDFRSLLDESLPKHPLLLPVWDDRNCAHFAFAEAGDVVGGGFKVEDRFLDVRGELGEVDDLRYAGTGAVGEAVGRSIVSERSNIAACDQRSCRLDRCDMFFEDSACVV